jgi:hypothetical protein
MVWEGPDYRPEQPSEPPGEAYGPPEQEDRAEAPSRYIPPRAYPPRPSRPRSRASDRWIALLAILLVLSLIVNIILLVIVLYRLG